MLPVQFITGRQPRLDRPRTKTSFVGGISIWPPCNTCSRPVSWIFLAAKAARLRAGNRCSGRRISIPLCFVVHPTSGSTKQALFTTGSAFGNRPSSPAVWSDCGTMPRVDSPAARFQAMDLKSSIDALPQIAMLDRRQSSKMFPAPIVLAPFIKAELQHPLHITTVGYDFHSRRSIDCFESADQGQQFQSFTGYAWLVITSRQERFAMGQFQMKLPNAVVFALDLGAGQQNDLGKITRHANHPITRVPGEFVRAETSIARS